MMQQPLMSGGIDAGSPITFPEEPEDPRVTVDTGAGGGIWGFFKVLRVTVNEQSWVLVDHLSIPIHFQYR
jgi:hypothetical protein